MMTIMLNFKKKLTIIAIFFYECWPRFRKKINVPKQPFKYNLNTSLNAQLICLFFQYLFACLKSNYSVGKDGISYKLIKIIHLEILQPLKHIINLIFKTGIVPLHFKISIITPITKANCTAKIQNYRPINLINNIAKIFEKALKERLIHFF